MRLEYIPLLLGLLVALLGAALIADAWMDDGTFVAPERRRRKRAERHRGGEAVVGLGTLCMAAALIGRDSWRFGTLTALLGAVLLAVGAVLNRQYLRELFAFRGPARRAPPPPEPDPQPPGPASPRDATRDTPRRLRIR